MLCHHQQRVLWIEELKYKQNIFSWDACNLNIWNVFNLYSVKYPTENEFLQNKFQNFCPYLKSYHSERFRLHQETIVEKFHNS